MTMPTSCNNKLYGIIRHCAKKSFLSSILNLLLINLNEWLQSLVLQEEKKASHLLFAQHAKFTNFYHVPCYLPFLPKQSTKKPLWSHSSALTVAVTLESKAVIWRCPIISHYCSSTRRFFLLLPMPSWCHRTQTTKVALLTSLQQMHAKFCSTWGGQCPFLFFSSL